jgi:hypothetical protein
MDQHPQQRPFVVLVIWALLAAAIGFAVFEQRWSLAFVAAMTFALSLLPTFFAGRFGILLPTSFVAAIVIFIFATIFLGEAFDFYERFWWWDVILHTGSAIGFGLVGFLFIFMMFHGDKYAAPPWALSFIAFCFAMTIGAVWEVFEFAMDQIFGMTMQKSGLDDTMWDLIVDAIGASLGALAGFLYLKDIRFAGLTGGLREFVAINRRFFSRLRK